ncbi:MAG TPA: hypothetical protein VF507_03335 [Pyrinomonadaceae bacterium]
MEERESSGELRLKVVCAWCDSVIRRASVKDSRGMCLKCYARMLCEYNRAQEGQRPRWASER